MGSVGDSRGNVLAQATNGLHKAEAIHRRRAWRSLEAVELAASDWVDGLSNRRLLESIGNIPPAEANHCAMPDDRPVAASHSNQHASGKPGAVQSGRSAFHAASVSQQTAIDNARYRTENHNFGILTVLVRKHLAFATDF